MVLAELFFSGSSDGEIIPCLSLSFSWLPGILRVTWHVDASLQSLPPLSDDVLPVVSVFK